MMKAGVADLKANLSAYLRRVKDGESVIVMDRDTPVARLVSIESNAGSGLRIRPARRSLSTLSQPVRLQTRVDIVELLLEERGER